MTVEPPLLAGAVQDTVDWVLDAVGAGDPGRAPGVPTVIELEGADGGPVPLVFLAVTVKV